MQLLFSDSSLGAVAASLRSIETDSIAKGAMLHSNRPAALATIPLERGDHPFPESGVCAMELVAYLAGEPHSSSPVCACPVLTEILRNWNDDLSCPDRNRLLKPLLPGVVGSRGSPELTAIRAWMAIDWLIHIWTPAWLELACYTEAAETIAAFPALTSAATAFPPYEFFEQLYDEHKNRWRYEIRPGLHEAVLGRALRLTGIGGMEEVFMEVMMEDPVRYFGDGDGGELWWPPLIRMAIGIGRNCALAVAGAAAAGEARPREAIQRVLLPTARELQASFITLLGQMTTRREGPSARIPTIDMA